MAAEDYLAEAGLWFAHDRRRCDDEPAADPGTIDLADLGNGDYQAMVAADDDCAPVPPPYRSDQLTRPHDPGNVLPESEHAEGFYLDIPEGREQRIYRGTGPSGVPAYYEYEPGRYLIYWFFYPYNEHIVGEVGARHEGDWEHITVRLDEVDHAIQVAYYQHECPPIVYGRGQLASGLGQDSTGLYETTHPIVYSALGSHASYPTRKRRWEPSDPCGLPAPLRVDAAQRGDPWDTSQHVMDARAADWYGFGGAWGPSGPEFLGVRVNDGPLGPSPHKLPGAVPEGW